METSDGYERDTSESNDVDINSFMKLPDDIMNTCDFFGSFYKRIIFMSWVSQPSPCCGAASVAGVLNSILGQRRGSLDHLDHIDILNVYKLMYIQKLHMKIASFERNLGFDMMITLKLLNIKLSESLFSSHKKNVSQALVKQAIRSINEQNRQLSTDDKDVLPADNAMNALIELFEKVQTYYFIRSLIVNILNCILHTLNQDAMDAKVSACTSYLPIPDEDDASSDHDDEILAPPPVPASNPLITAASKADDSRRPRLKLSSRATSSTTPTATNQWNWLSELVTIFKLIHGYQKLNHSTRPNTAPIGNTDVINAINRVSEFLNLSLKPEIFMGRKSKIKQMAKSEFPITLSTLDGEGAVQDQWDVLK